MLSNVDPVLLTIGLTALAAIAFFFGAVLDAVMHESGFGPTGNAVLFAAGFVGAVYVAHMRGMDYQNLTLIAAGGFGGSFALFSLLALLKAGLARR